MALKSKIPGIKPSRATSAARALSSRSKSSVDTTPENRAKGMGGLGAALGLGFVLGPAMGGLLAGGDPASINVAIPSYVAAALSAVALVVALFSLKESLTPALTQQMIATGRAWVQQAGAEVLQQDEAKLKAQGLSIQ